MEVDREWYIISGRSVYDEDVEQALGEAKIEIFKIASFLSDGSLELTDKFKTLPVEYAGSFNGYNWDGDCTAIMRFISINGVEPDISAEGPTASVDWDSGVFLFDILPVCSDDFVYRECPIIMAWFPFRFHVGHGS